VKVSVFKTCLVESLFPEVADALVTLLQRLSLDVDVPEMHTCCGQMHINSGYEEMAFPLIRNQVATFANSDFVVAPSASCVSSIRHQYENIVTRIGDRVLVDAVQSLAQRTFEVSEFLVDVLGVTDVGSYYPHRVTYHPTCHSLRSLRVKDRPIRLLEEVEALELVVLPDAEVCCGFGGTFSLKNADVSGAMLDDKISCIKRSGANNVAALDSSCLMQIGGGLSRQELDVRPIHIVQILASTR
jgi:L-lactate dehydrogenase complex protein LldE